MAMTEHLAKDALDALIQPHMTVWLQLTLSTPAVALGRLAVLRGALGLSPRPPSQHVQPDRTRHRRGLRL